MQENIKISHVNGVEVPDIHWHISEVCAERQLQQKPEPELVARRSNCIALPHTTCRAPVSSYKPHAHTIIQHTKCQAAADVAGK